MEIDHTPFYRRSITPWYDSDPICWLVVIFMISILIFSGIGLKVVKENPHFLPHIWVPSILVFMSCATLISTVVRMVRRHRNG